jgi:hypothetical protein
MLSAAFDASGSKTDQAVLLVAGFVSSVDGWIEFDREWKARLLVDGLGYFHAQKFAQSSGPFRSGWKDNEQRRRDLLRDLVGIIRGNTHQKFATLIFNDIHAAEMSKEIRETFYLEAYPLAGRTVAKKVMDYARSFSARFAPEFVFEDGDFDKGKLMQRFANDGYPGPIFRPKDTPNKKAGLMELGYTPLQAADLWAYELFLAEKKHRNGVPPEEFRWASKELDRVPGEAGFYSAQDMHRLENMLTQQRSGSDLIIDPSSGAVLLPGLSEK